MRINRFFPLLLTFVTALLMACGSDPHVVLVSASHADSVIFDAGAAKDYGRMLELVDSFEMTGSLTPINANRWRGVAYYRQGQYRPAELWYRRALESNINSEQDQVSYVKSARRLSELLLVKGDYEGSLKVALPAVAKMRQTGFGSDIDFAILLNNIGCCQLNLGRGDEAQESFYTARQHYINRWSTDSTGRGFQEAVIGTVYTSQAYINTRRFEESLYWIDRTEMLLGKYSEKPDARVEYFDEYKGRIEIMRAVAMQGLGRTTDARLAYSRFLNTNYASTASGKIYATEYLLSAERYKEAADNFKYLDQVLSDWGTELNLDNIQLYVLPKMKANLGAQRRDSVIALAGKLCDIVDSALAQQKNDETAELATIYETQEKDARIASQETQRERERLITSLVALFLVVLFFSVYIFMRSRSAARLSHAYEKLQTAYDQLEETTAIKERIESELEIAHDIQMSMVPSQFPVRDGLDISGSMTAAKQVGGDLYGFLLVDDRLYFCIGDVCGKGVPASIFMAQTARLFRTLASQRLMPADIATRMNAELTENNERGMFVTMFLGVIDLTTYKLEYCNAGHNPPLLLGITPEGERVNMGGMFMQMNETNAPLGLFPDLEFVGEKIDDIKNLPLFLYTDGLTEAENQRQQQFGEDRLMEIFETKFFNSAQEVNDYIVKAVTDFRHGAEPNDDLTMLIIRAY